MKTKVFQWYHIEILNDSTTVILLCSIHTCLTTVNSTIYKMEICKNIFKIQLREISYHYTNESADLIYTPRSSNC